MKCYYVLIGAKITSEVKRIMKPLPPMNPSNSRVHFEKPTRQRKGKKSYSNFSVAKFQKKPVVFKYMSDHPSSFTIKDSYILLRGLLPEISINAKEYEIRSDIISLHNVRNLIYTISLRRTLSL